MTRLRKTHALKTGILLSTFCIFTISATPNQRNRAPLVNSSSLFSINESSSWLSITTYAFLTAVTATVVHCVVPPLIQRILPPPTPLSPAQYQLAKHQQKIEMRQLKQQEREADYEIVNTLREAIAQSPEGELKARLQEQYQILISHMAEQVIERLSSKKLATLNNSQRL